MAQEAITGEGKARTPMPVPVLYVAGGSGFYEPAEAQRKGHSSPLPWIKSRTPADNSEEGQRFNIAIACLRAEPDGLSLLGFWHEVQRAFAARNAPTRWYLLNAKYEPATVPQIASLLGVTVDQALRGLQVLLDVRLLEWVTLPDFAEALKHDRNPKPEGLPAGMVPSLGGLAGRTPSARRPRTRRTPSARTDRGGATHDTRDSETEASPPRHPTTATEPTQSSPEAVASESGLEKQETKAETDPTADKRQDAPTAEPLPGVAAADAQGDRPEDTDAPDAADGDAETPEAKQEPDPTPINPTPSDPRPGSAGPSEGGMGELAESPGPAGSAVSREGPGRATGAAVPHGPAVAFACDAKGVAFAVVKLLYPTDRIGNEYAARKKIPLRQFVAEEVGMVRAKWESVLLCSLTDQQLLHVWERTRQEAERYGRKSAGWRRCPGAGLGHWLNHYMGSLVGTPAWAAAKGRYDRANI